MQSDSVERTGLTQAEAEARLLAEGPNSLPEASRRTTMGIVVGVLQEPMFLLLVACGALYFLVGDPQEALMLLGFVAVIIGITVVQERRTERALDALRDLSQPRAVVIRGGERLNVSTHDVVRGDLVVVSEGQRVPADGLLLKGSSLVVDESLLTGESMAVRKAPWAAGSNRVGDPGGDDTPFLFGGTLVVRGSGVVEVTAIATDTQMGRIGVALATLSPGKSRLQEETKRIVRIVAIAAVGVSLAVTVIYGVTRGAWLEGVLSGLATAMALLPEEFPVVLTVFLALGASRLSRVGVLTRRMAAIEALGTTTVLCTDKTGTLTQNRMVVSAIWASGAVYTVPPDTDSIPEALRGVLEHAVLASSTEPTDPMEQAIHALGRRALSGTERLHPDWTLAREYALSSTLLTMTRAWNTSEGLPVERVSAKGSPEAIFDLCHLDPSEVTEISARLLELAGRGLRVLGVAHADHTGSALPEGQHDFEFTFDGLIAFEDPLRTEVPAAIVKCHQAGVRVIMVTGDYPATGLAIAKAAGLPESVALAGPEISALDDAALAARLRETHVAARIAPQDKLRIVRVLQEAGEVVAMTGDGVNDAPALTAADIGVAMGKRGTEVAREAADLVLVDDDFASLVVAMAHGRRIFENLQSSMGYILAIHVPLAGLAVIPVLAGWPVALLPVHIVLLELVIDPACSLVFEAEPADPESMSRPPRPPDAAMIDRHIMLGAVLQGLVVLGATLAVFYRASSQFPDSPDTARTLAFVTLMVSNVGLILANRSWEHSAWFMLKRSNPVFPWVVVGSLALLFGVTYIPVLNEILHFVSVPLAQFGAAALAGLASLILVELLKAAVLRVPRGPKLV